jgi:hypothetical protein
MPIYFDEEHKGWKFDQLTEKEKEVFETTAEALMIQMFTSNILQFAINRVNANDVDMEQYLRDVDPKALHET